MIKLAFLISSYLTLLCASGMVAQEVSEQPDCDAEVAETCVEFAPLGEPSEFIESSTGVKLAVRRWIPKEEIKAVLLFHHGGAGWHSGYSDILGRFMKENGIAFVAYDTVGCGYSEGIDGLRGYIDSIDTVTNDFTKILNDTQAKYPGRKVFAMGESFGCLVLLHQILKEQETEGGSLADGYIFAGPVVKLLPEMLPPKPVIAIFKLLSRFFPMLDMPGSDFFSTFDLAFGDKRWAMAGRADPFIREAAKIPPKLGMAASLLEPLSKSMTL